MSTRGYASSALFFFLKATATTDIYTLSLHDALPILRDRIDREYAQPLNVEALARDANISAGHLSRQFKLAYGESDRKSTRLNSSHVRISYAVFCLKKKKTQQDNLCD